MYLPDDLSIQLELFSPGKNLYLPDDAVDTKMVPYTVVVQVIRGHYQAYRDGLPARIDAGDVFLSAANVPLHFVHHADPSQGPTMAARWIHASFTLFGSIDFTSMLELPLRIPAERAGGIGAVLDRVPTVNNASPDHPLLGLARRQQLAFELLRTLCELAPMKRDRESFVQDSRRIARVVSYIKANLATPIEGSDLAHQAHMSSSQFYLIFQRCMGMPPLQYVRRIRLAEAARMLMRTDQSIAEIAQHVGFSNPFHFSRVFKEHFSLSPRAYRRNTHMLERHENQL